MNPILATTLGLALFALPLAATANPPQSTWLYDEVGNATEVRWGQGEPATLGDYRQPFDAMDANGDGVIHRADVPTDHALAFEWHLVDTNRDGAITPGEYAGWARP